MADDAPAPQSTQGADKTQAPATFSSFINKNTTGKKFAPKAARRRPAAAAPKPVVVGPESSSTTAAVASQPESSTTAAAATVAASQPEHESSNTATAPLPTPAPTQNTAPLDPSATSAVHVVPERVSSPPPPPHPINVDDNESGRSPKRRRLESPQAAPMAPVAVMLPPQEDTPAPLAQLPSTAAEQPRTSIAATPHTETPSTEPSASTAATPSTEPASTEITSTETDAPTRTRRTLPWTAVNHPHDDGGEATDPVEPPAAKKRAPPKPRRRKQAADVEQDNGVGHGDEQEVEPTTRQPSARARGKRRADAPETGQDGEPVEPPPKKPRKPRKDKGKQPAAEGETDVNDDTTTTAKPKRKKRTPSTPVEDSAEPKRRGRPPREDTPSDAEDHTIDPDAMCMDDLASRNIRVGKLSRREKEMRKIDWDAVKQRRREEDARHITTKEAQAAVDKLLETGEPEQTTTGPRYHVVDGRIELVQDSGTIDRERDADREIELMTITEEDDLTTRITSRSFMKNNKRFPNDFVLPGQGKRWTPQSTEIFYQGLRSFGTDFQMIAHMFPGMTRRSIKTKFTREERENPDLIRDCLRGESELASHWDHFLEASQLQEDSFADADLIKRELADEETRMREQIDEALREKAERDKQRKIAGVTDDAEGEKENGKGKKKRKLKDKNVTFQEEGVEILGEVDEDPNWGVE